MSLLAFVCSQTSIVQNEFVGMLPRPAAQVPMEADGEVIKGFIAE